jgi:hypothetical protein
MPTDQRPRRSIVRDVTDEPEFQPSTTNLVWKVKQNGNTVASCITAEDGLTTMQALAAASDGLDGWSLHFDTSVV